MDEQAIEAPAVEAPPVRSDGLQLEEHRSFQQKLWTVARGAWVVFAAIIVAALLGVTGAGGYFAHSRAQMEGGEIEFPRFARWEAADAFKITFAVGGAEHSVTLSPAFAETFQIEDIQPEPENSEARPDGERLTFNAVAGAPAIVHLHVRAQSPGIARFWAAIDGGARQNFTTFVLP